MNKYSVEVKHIKVSEFVVEAKSIKEAEEIVENIISTNNIALYAELINKQITTNTTKGKKINRWWNK